jgi:rare lipoprotein A
MCTLSKSVCFRLCFLIFLFTRFSTDAEAKDLTASYYSIASLKAEGTYAYSGGRMANGKPFRDDAPTCASWDYPLGTIVKVTRKDNGKSVTVQVCDRTARRFKGKRIDLSISAMRAIDGVKQGLVPCTVEVVQ